MLEPEKEQRGMASWGQTWGHFKTFVNLIEKIKKMKDENIIQKNQKIKTSNNHQNTFKPPLQEILEQLLLFP